MLDDDSPIRSTESIVCSTEIVYSLVTTLKKWVTNHRPDVSGSLARECLVMRYGNRRRLVTCGFRLVISKPVPRNMLGRIETVKSVKSREVPIDHARLKRDPLHLLPPSRDTKHSTSSSLTYICIRVLEIETTCLPCTQPLAGDAIIAYPT